MRLAEDWLASWEIIVDQVDKDHVPIECVSKIVFRFVDRRQKTVNLQRLRQQGLDSDDIHVIIDKMIQTFGDDIANIEFVLDIKAVAEMLQPETDKLLRSFKL